MVTFKVKHIKTAPSRKGGTYYYCRITGKRIHSEFGTAEFVAEVERIRAEHDVAKKLPPVTSFGGLVLRYRKSPEFKNLAERTRKDYMKVFEYLEPLRDVPIAEMDAPYLMKLRDKTFKKRKRHFTNYVRTVLSVLFNWGEPRGITDGNPAEKVPKIKKTQAERNTPVNRPWEDWELDVVLEAAKPNMRVAIALGAWTALREGDVLRFPRSAYDPASGMIKWMHWKNGEDLVTPVHSRLKAILDAAPKKSPIFVTGANGRPYTEDGFRTMLWKLVKPLEKAGKVNPGLTFHGLRHTIATSIANAGGENRDIMSLTGHTTDASVRRYTRQADKVKRAKRVMEMIDKGPED